MHLSAKDVPFDCQDEETDSSASWTIVNWSRSDFDKTDRMDERRSTSVKVFYKVIG